jgi:hypothetical protein
MHSTTSESTEEERFSPRRYMRARHPHLFSDSKQVSIPSVTREVLSHHIETLTNQTEESAFETFARRLAGKFVSPNLKPQTGPFGGGDGKTDSETYPVAEAVAQRWFVSDTAGAHEHWAFAFSCQKDWRSKVRRDVMSIVGTGQGFLRIYFVSNQFIPSKDNTAAREALTKEFGVPVNIFDRTWLLDRVFDDDSLDIAVDTLGVGAGAAREERQVGPEDLRRQTELAELDRVLGNPGEYQGTPHALVEDSHRSALLVRGLERSRYEIDGRFQRTVRLAREHELPKLELAAVYDWAWTTNFWLEDPREASVLYDAVETLAIDSDVADDLEKLSNLLSCVSSNVAFGLLSPAAAKLGIRSARLKAALARVEADGSRPNNALHARSLGLMTRLAEFGPAVRDGADISGLEGLWNEFRDLIVQAEGLGTFPFEPIANALTEIGEFVPESEAFDALYEALTDALVKRRSEGEAARRNMTRGYQKLEKQLPYEAIRWFGRAVGLLVKAEYADDLVQALVGCSIAYEDAGLPWAARNYALAAASQQFSAFKRSGSVEEVSPAVLSQWYLRELRIGRIPYVLNAFQLGAIIAHAHATTDERRTSLAKRVSAQNQQIGALLLQTPFNVLDEVCQLPDALERMGLPQARMALMFLLGREDILRSEGWVPKEETPEGYAEFFELWAFHGAQAPLPVPDFMLDDVVELRSRVIGCDLVMSCANNITSISVAESLLGSLEALLATSLNYQLLPNTERLRIRVSGGAADNVAPVLEFVEEGGERVGKITHADSINFASRDDAVRFMDWLHQAVIETFIALAVPQQFEKWRDDVLTNENAFSRALTFSNVLIPMNVIFGTEKERLSIGEWIEDADVLHGNLRTAPWVPKHTVKTASSEKPLFSDAPPPEDMRNMERQKHTDIRVVSPIDVNQWNAAKWRAAFFMTAPGSDVPPVFGLAFENAERGAAIFKGWRGRFGLDDAPNTVRIAVIRGVRASNPHAYAVVVGPNADNIPTDATTLFEFISRIQTMTPSSSENLDRFLAEFERHGRFLLAPAHLPTLKATPSVELELGIGKYDLAVRQGWEIGPNDPDLMALDPDDPPIIPANVTDAPVLKTLERIRGSEARRRRRR